MKPLCDEAAVHELGVYPRVRYCEAVRVQNLTPRPAVSPCQSRDPALRLFSIADRRPPFTQIGGLVGLKYDYAFRRALRAQVE